MGTDMFPGEDTSGIASDTNNDPIPKISPFWFKMGAPAHKPFAGTVYIGLSRKYSHQPAKGLLDTDLTIEPTPRLSAGKINRSSSEFIMSEFPKGRGLNLIGTTDLIIPNPEV